MSANSFMKYILVAGLLSSVSVTSLFAQAILTETEQSNLQFMREEEKLARDVYTHLHSIWGSAVFSSIAVAEQRHMDAVLKQLNTYGIADPAEGNSAGVFLNSTLQQLYDDLVVQGEVSEVFAMQVGITIEETDIADLDVAISATNQSSLLKLYSNLRRGSLNHLSAFSNNYAALGGTNEPASQNGNSLLPGTSIYEPISETLYIPALDLVSDTGATVVYDVLLRLVETLPQALEVVSVTETTKLPSANHASFDAATGILNIPDVSFSTVVVPDENNRYSLSLQLLSATEPATIFVVTQLQAK